MHDDVCQEDPGPGRSQSRRHWESGKVSAFSAHVIFRFAAVRRSRKSCAYTDAQHIRSIITPRISPADARALPISLTLQPTMALPAPTIDLLLNLIDTRPQSILSSLEQHPHLASARDAHGYSLVHAAASYNQLAVLRDLVQKYNADVNILDEDGETPLFACEKAEVAKCLVEELGADTSIKNQEGQTAEDKFLEEEDATHEVYQYLTSLRTGHEPAAAGVIETEGVHPPPPLPDGVKVNVGTMEEDAVDAPDPEIRRRIEELAARPDYDSEEVQQQLRELVQDVVGGMGAADSGRSVRPRVD